MAATRLRRGAAARFVALCAIALLVSAGCGTQDRADPSSSQETGIWRASIVSADADAQAEEAAPLVEWLDPSSGAWRREHSGETRIFAGTTYAVIDQWGVRLRTGSSAFLLKGPSNAVAMDALVSYLDGTAEEDGIEVVESDSGDVELHFAVGHGQDVVATIEPVAQAEAPDLFAIPAENVVVDHREVAVGHVPNLPVEAYWFGPTIEFGVQRSAVTAAQYTGVATPEMIATGGWSVQDNRDVYMVFYEDFASGGRTSATSTEPPPENELQVVSQAITSESAKQDLAAFNGTLGDLKGPVWPREEVRLANGETATVFIDTSEDLGREGITFAVATDTTLINVNGHVKVDEIMALVSLLRPVASTE
jgi:hypothetical protein